MLQKLGSVLRVWRYLRPIRVDVALHLAAFSCHVPALERMTCRVPALPIAGGAHVMWAATWVDSLEATWAAMWADSWVDLWED